MQQGFVRRLIPAIAMLAIAICVAACGGGSGHPSSVKLTIGPSGSAGQPVSAAGIGFYDGKYNSAGIEKAASWLGSPGTVKYAEDFIDATDWAHISDPWQLGDWKGTPYTMVWGVPMLPCGGPSTQCKTNIADYDLLAQGGADGYYKTLAQHLVSAGFGSSYIRIGWEFNGSDMAWGICNQEGSGLTSWASDFVPAYRNIVTSMRSVSGANFKFVWNPLESSNVSCPGVHLENYYPGDKYVDVIALDVYDGLGQTVSSDAARWSDLLNGLNGGEWTAETPFPINGQKFKGYGLDWVAPYAKEHGKLVSIPEWGLNTTNTNGGGGDDAYFVSHMASWIKANSNGPAIFWNYADGNMPLDIPNYTSGNTPNATAAFKAAFGAGS